MNHPGEANKNLYSELRSKLDRALELANIIVDGAIKREEYDGIIECDHPFVYRSQVDEGAGV